MHASQIAASVRTALKAAKIPARAVSVKTHSYSMGASIRVEIKSADVSAKIVRDIANAHESVRRDERSGDVLSGGNLFVFVRYHSDTLDVLRARYIDAVNAAAALLATSDRSTLIPVAGTPFTLGYANNATPSDTFWIAVWGDSCIHHGCTADDVALTITVRMIDVAREANGGAR